MLGLPVWNTSLGIMFRAPPTSEAGPAQRFFVPSMGALMPSAHAGFDALRTF